MRLDKHGIPNVIVNPLPGMAPGFSDYPKLLRKRAGPIKNLLMEF